jgi:hypothetical protein
MTTIKRNNGGWIVTWPNGTTTRTATFAEAKAEVLYYDEIAHQQAGEQAAEAAWLRAAESHDDGFEAWERGRGCDADPQSGY